MAFTLNLSAQANGGDGWAEAIFSVGGVLRTVQARGMERNPLIYGEALAALRKIPVATAQLVIADLPLFPGAGAHLGRHWPDADGYIEWSLTWLDEAMRVVRLDGLFIASASWEARTHLSPSHVRSRAPLGIS